MPAVLLAFANWVDDKCHLRSLLEEAEAIGKALGLAVQAGLDVLSLISDLLTSTPYSATLYSASPRQR